ncbi:MAG: helicase C-terminal domain-containing protein [Anaerolineales bacterium]
MPALVAIDIETTGLDSQKDAIIEIGAVRFHGTVVEDEWTTLINPGRPIPPFITQLTGINNEMVARQPHIQEVYAGLLDFVGDLPVVGHNVGFDLSFLRRRGGFGKNLAVDTYELASVLLPTAERYNLGALAERLKIDLPATHRALDDARVTHELFLQLFELAQQIPVDLLAEIVRLGSTFDWGANLALREALHGAARQPIKARRTAISAPLGPLFERTAARSAGPLRPVENPVFLDTDEVAALLEHGGAFSRHFPNFEYRPEQVAMLRAVTQSLNEGRHLLVEAGTGTGKSVAYLLPAALFAIQNQTRVVVSTNTINLQDQLINKDIPDIRSALGIDLLATVLKGRSNYLCPRRMENMRRRQPESVEELRVLAKVLVWMQTTRTGDRGEINLNGPVERDIWNRLSAEDPGCTAEMCIKRTGGACPFHQVRQASQSAHILIVNHALLLSDIATGSRVLPEYEHLIIDEGHHIEDATTNALSFRVSLSDIERLLKELGSRRSGIMGRLLTIAHDILDPDQIGALTYLVEQATDVAFRVENLTRQFFYMLDHFLFEQRQGRGPSTYSQQERILPATRTQPAWMDVEVAWDEADQAYKPLLEYLGNIVQAAAEMSISEVEELEDIFSNVSNVHRRIYAAYTEINALVFSPTPDKIYWVETNPNGQRLLLNSAPLQIGPLMEMHLWHAKTSIVLTSATLTAAGEFEYMRNRLGAYEAEELALGSPFDFESAALLYVANDIPEPNDRSGHQRAIEHALINICRSTGGRTLALFTSYDQLRRTSRAISPVLGKYGISVLEQGEGASSHALLENFRETEQAVLLGTRAFWEGVDVPGEALSVLVIAKLPFDVPSDPIIAARSETFEDPFYQFSLPEAILRFRQGFGRLIRTQYDRGVVIILDKRVLTKRYGRLFIESLPPCTKRMGPLAEASDITVQWLNI